MLTSDPRARALLIAIVFTATAFAGDPFDDGVFKWKAGGPLIDVGTGKDEADPHLAIKDPTVVYHGGKWHVIATLRKQSGKVMMEQLSFADWEHANEAPRTIIELHDAYHCAPQVFWFTPHQRWYLVYQAGQFRGRKGLTPVFSTTTNLADAKSWSKPEPMITTIPETQKWIDFWVICDATKAHLFYTSDDGHFWRRETKKTDFPLGWSGEVLAMKDTKEALFEASHTYKLKGREQYLTILEAIAPGRRYYKAYLADKLDGEWRPLAGMPGKPFAARENIEPLPSWIDSVSHGELLRAGVDEFLEVDPQHLRFLIQGVDAGGYQGKYGGIPWRLGLLELIR
jgi:hypothetical protein